MRWYAHSLRMNEDRIPKKVLNMKVKENTQEENQDRNNRLGKTSHREKEGHRKKLRRKRCGKTEKDGEA
jgi:hypothetical protein